MPSRWNAFFIPSALLLLVSVLSTNVGGARADTTGRTPVVVYVDPNGGLFKASKRQLAALCWTVDAAGTMDYARCCPEGFAAVGLTVEGNLACLQR